MIIMNELIYLYFISIFSTLLICFFIYKKHQTLKQIPFCVGFFHPFSDSGGGGERVLWTIIQIFQTHYPKISIILYTGYNNEKSPLSCQHDTNSLATLVKVKKCILLFEYIVFLTFLDITLVLLSNIFI